MKPSTSLLHLLTLILLCLPALSQGHNREVWVFIKSFHHDFMEDEKLSLMVQSKGKQYSASRFISHQDNWYRFSYETDHKGEEYFELSFDGKVVHEHFPPGDETVFLAIRSLALFPLGVDIWTESQVLASIASSNTEIEGEIPIPSEKNIKIPEKVELYQPFSRYLSPEKLSDKLLTFSSDYLDNPTMAIPITPEEDWSRARFLFKFPLTNPSLVFLKVEGRYFPMAVQPNRNFHVTMSPKKSSKWTISKHPSFEWEDYVEMESDLDLDDDHLGQIFFNKRYPKGLNHLQYRRLVRTLQNLQPGRSDTLRAWAHSIVALYEKEDQTPDEFLHIINMLGEESLKEVFEDVYDKKLHKQEHIVLSEREDIREGILILLVLSLIVFVLGLVGRLINPGSFFSNHLNKVEILFHFSLWSVITFSFSTRIMYDYWLVNNPLNMLFLWATGALFYVNALYLVPRLLVKKKFKMYLVSLLGMGVAFGFTIFLYEINPFKNFSWTYIQNDWHGGYWRFNHYEEGLPPLFCISLVLAPVYGLLRNLLVNRVPQLQQQKGHLTAELKALKTQISPHFFFNSLNTVYSFALGEESPKTAEAITKLSDMMRFVIYHGDKRQVPLTKELEYLEDYIELQRLRTNKVRHDIRFNITGDPGDLNIAPLILITPIENAFKHGISMSKDSFIYMDLLIQEKGIILTVENSLHEGQLIPISGKTLGEEESGVGITNTRQRLDLLYPSDYEWYTEEGLDRYYTQLCIDLV
ncbi:MAG: sensor histidine kinase [Bacteroidia bacterium]|nr:sensor histidine kinase [Bacteroidia bacterium]